jgi:hypothetical protein
MNINNSKQERNISPFTDPATKMRRLWRVITGSKRVLIPVTLVAVLAASAILWAPILSSPANALTSKCTLSIFTGSVDVIVLGTSDIQPGIDGMTLDAGNRVKTSVDTTALLTFFDGSTIQLEPCTDIEIEQLERNDDQQVNIILKQWTGETWSHVVKMVDRRFHYEIKTPSAIALVRGTQFLTEVDQAGATKVLTAEGLVSVSAQGEEIFLPEGQQTEVEPGNPPSTPKHVDVAEYITSQQKVQKEDKINQSNHSIDSINYTPYKEGNHGNSAFANAQSNENGQGNYNDQSQGNVNSQGNDNNNGKGNGNCNSNGNDQSQGNVNSQGNDNNNSQGNGNGNSNGNDQSRDKTITPEPTTPADKSEKTK